MSRRKFGPTERAENSLCRPRFDRRCCDSARSGKGPKKTVTGFHSVIFRVANFVALCAIAYACCASPASRAQQPDFGIYARAVGFCRGVTKRPMALDLDKRVLCFDGSILLGSDVSIAGALEPNGLFVVRSFGGSASAAIALAGVMRDRHATVVV